MAFVRPRRTATIRTRWDLEQIREQIGAIAQAERPEGMEGFLARGYFRGGRGGTRDFHLDFHYNALRLRAQSRWIEAG